MATTKRSRNGAGKSTTSRSRSTAASKTASRAGTSKAGSTKGRSQSAKPRTTRSSAKTTRTTAKRTRAASANGASRARSSASGNGTNHSRNGTRGTTGATQDRVVRKLRQTGTAVRHATDRAGGPTITVAAAVAGIAGGLALRQRPRATPDGLAARSMAVLHDVDPSAVLGGLGKATVQLSRRSRSVARDIERVAEQAERLGKILS
jgi:hypothetical protein